mmetsp:Transcript_3861/g.16992  ORF Transcript_3861/g.16992 Transcript_3861/m.16992 type:complete len:279 (+) Transcript_3861:287-1123(+)
MSKARKPRLSRGFVVLRSLIGAAPRPVFFLVLQRHRLLFFPASRRRRRRRDSAERENRSLTVCSPPSLQQIASDGLKGRIFECSLADLQQDEDQAFRKMLLKCEDVQGTNVLTQFAGMDFTTDKLRSLVRKWFSLIETFVDVKTTDQYTLRVFCIGFTKRRMDQTKRTCYAQSGQIRQIRKKMNDIIRREISSCDLKESVLKFIPEVIGKEIEKVCAGIYPLQNVYIRKVKILKRPKFDVTKLMEVHGDYSGEDAGAKVDRPKDLIEKVEKRDEVVGA